MFIVFVFLCFIVEKVPGPPEFRESSIIIISCFIINDPHHSWLLSNAHVKSLTALVCVCPPACASKCPYA